MRYRFASTFMGVGVLVFVAVSACGGDDENGANSGGGTAGSGGSAGNTTAGNNSTAGTLAQGGVGMGSPEPTGSTCQEAADCYAGLDTSELSGAAECIDKVENGYCTHECETDDDCCAVEGECRTGFKQVCASFEDSDVKYCFLSCEEEDLVPAAGGAPGVGGAAAVDANEYCAREAHPRFGCRSTGGGVENRRVCLPDAGVGGAPGMGGAGPGMGGAGPDQGGAPGAAGMSVGGESAGGVGTGGVAEPLGGQGGVAIGGAGGAGGAP